MMVDTRALTDLLALGNSEGAGTSPLDWTISCRVVKGLLH